MKIKDLSHKALRFSGENHSLPTVSESGVLIRIIELDDWLHVMIDVGEDSTSRSLRETIPLAIEWRDRLLKWQGPWMRGGATPFLEELARLSPAKISYKKLAKRINEKVSALLVEYWHYLKELENARPHFKTMLDFYLWHSSFNQFAAEHAKDMLVMLGIKAEEADELIRLGIENIESGIKPFEDDYPISRDKLIRTLRTWSDSRKRIIVQGLGKQQDSL